MSPQVIPEQFNLQDPEIQKNPYPYYPVLRDRRPVLKTTFGGHPCWILSRREEINRVLMDPRTFSNKTAPLPNMLFSDSPEHERLRLMVAGMFTREAVKPMSEEIRAHAESLLVPLLDRGGCDIISDFAGPLTVGAIARLLGISNVQVERLRQLSRLFVDHILALQIGLPPAPEAIRATEELSTLMMRLVEARAYEDGRVFSALVRARDRGDLTEQEFVNFALLILVAGHSTTTNLIGNAVYVLAQRTADLDRLATDEAFVEPYVEEVLRTRPSFHRIVRVTARQVELCGEVIPAGSMLRLLLASANRDETTFEDAETFDPDQKRRAHLSFGRGIHTCLGNWLARLEAAIALTVLARRLDSVTLDAQDPPVAATGGTFNDFGFERLPIRFTGRRETAPTPGRAGQP